MGFKSNDIDDFDLDELLKETSKKDDEEDKTKKKKKKSNGGMIKAVIGIVIAIIVVAAIVFAGKNGSISKSGNTKKGGSAAETENESNNPLQEDAYEEISDVVTLYMNAKLKGDIDALSQYVDNMDGITKENLAAESSYIQEYSSITCYTKNGLYDNTYVVYVYYDLQLKNIKTLVPGITTLYVIRDKDTGNIYIHNGVTDGEVLEYIKKLSKEKDVVNLFNDVNKSLNDAIASDAQLKSFYEALQKKENEEKTTAAAK